MRCAGWQNPRMKVADGIHRLGPGVVNVYLLEEAGEITIIDAGMPGDWSDLYAEVELTSQLGRRWLRQH